MMRTLRLPLLLAFSLLLSATAAFPILRRHDPSFLYAPSSPSTLLSQEPAPALYMEQPLDHFSFSSSPTFLQRYFVNSTLYTPGSPVFLSLGGEGPLTASSVSSRSALASFYAPPFHPLLVAIEHRGYGGSLLPSPPDSTSLPYLTSHQALADAAHLLQNLSLTLPLPSSTPIIVFGGSYAGALSAWMKLTYPTIITGSIASSAPTRATVDFAGYLRHVQHVLGEECASVLRQATALMEGNMSTSAGRVQLLELFNQCEDGGEGMPGYTMNAEKDRSMFVNNALGPITALVQYNTNYRQLNISSACAFLTSPDRPDSLVALARFNALYNTAENASYPFATGAACQNTSYALYTNHTLQDPHSADRAWLWQTCNEVGFMQTAEGDDSAFSTRYLSLAFFTDQCADAFPDLAPFDLPSAINRTNAAYHSYDTHTDRTAFVNGGVDPWHLQSLTAPTDVIGESNRVELIPTTSHCQDIAAPHPTDSDELVLARWRNVQSIGAWLGGGEMVSSTGGGEDDSSSSTGAGGGGAAGGKSGSMSYGALVGIAVFVIFVVAVGASAAGVWWWKRGRFRMSGEADGQGYDSSLLSGNSSLLGSDNRAL